MTNNSLICILGPTASGKTSLSIELATIYDGEIVSADSMQIYKQLDIGTAKPTVDEMKGIPHHLIGFLDINETCSVADYALYADKAIKNILNKNKVPFLVGGTGQFIQAIVDNIQFGAISINQNRRNELIAFANKKGNNALHNYLSSIDSMAAERIHPNNVKRVIRAIEIFEESGKSIIDFEKESKQTPSPYKTCQIGITYLDRNTLYNRINKRVDSMIENGLLEEARNFYEKNYSNTSVQAIGYKEFFPYFRDESNLNDCIEKLKQNTRNYAKRQLTWFRKDPRIHWIYCDNLSLADITDKAKQIIQNYYETNEV